MKAPKHLGKHHPYYRKKSYADVIRKDIQYMKQRKHGTKAIKKALSKKWGVRQKTILRLIYTM